MKRQLPARWLGDWFEEMRTMRTMMVIVAVLALVLSCCGGSDD